MNPSSPSSPGPAANAAAPSSSPATASSVAEASVDVHALAEKVYRLLLADLSLERRRHGAGQGGRP
ncbi:hypothetical protein [Deinococcus altitudinis]|uniref:hypothetical protein n=1 Tax=Deinococcus altitudinis TaxID=468914 RepID=UPI00389273CD